MVNVCSKAAGRENFFARALVDIYDWQAFFNQTLRKPTSIEYGDGTSTTSVIKLTYIFNITSEGVRFGRNFAQPELSAPFLLLPTEPEGAVPRAPFTPPTQQQINNLKVALRIVPASDDFLPAIIENRWEPFTRTNPLIVPNLSSFQPSLCPDYDIIEDSFVIIYDIEKRTPVLLKVISIDENQQTIRGMIY
jgi:hypothetical protein